MAEVTEGDREKATQVVESLVGYGRDQFDDDPYEGREMAWVPPIAAALAEEREKARDQFAALLSVSPTLVHENGEVRGYLLSQALLGTFGITPDHIASAADITREETP